MVAAAAHGLALGVVCRPARDGFGAYKVKRACGVALTLKPKAYKPYTLNGPKPSVRLGAQP